MGKRFLAAILVLIIIACYLPATPVLAADNDSGKTYYVSSIHGEQGNNGLSEQTPFDSLIKINEITLGPGDRVLLEYGSVFENEYLHIQGSGSKDAPIVIDVYGDEKLPKPLIATNGQGVWYQDYGKRLDNTLHKYRGNVSSCILLYDVEYIEISNIAMTNEGNFAAGEVYNSLSRYDRTGVAAIAENIGTVDHIYLRNLDVRNVQGHVRNKHMANGGIYFLCHKPDNDAVTGVSKFDDVLIEGCRLDEVNRWGIAVGYTAYWDEFVYGPTIDPEVCQTYGSTNVVIRNNYLTNVGGDGITTMYCYQPLMEYNVLSGYCQDMTDEIYGPSDGQLVAAGIWPWMCKSAVMQYNEVYDSTPNPDGQAWDADWGDNAIYQYNYSCNNAGGAVMFCGQWACNTVFRYNISQNDLAGVLNLASSPNGEIYNNVFYIKEDVKINRTGMSGGRGNSIYNNIFYYSGKTPADSSLGNWGDISAEWNNNVYYNYSTTPSDPNSITEDPMFVDPGKAPVAALLTGKVHDRSVFDGYKLQEASPAIDAGKSVNAAGRVGLNQIEGTDSNKDFFGNELDLIPDIGVYETGYIHLEAERFEKVSVPVGETVTVYDETGIYSESDITELDSAIATVSLKASASVERTLGRSVTTLADGKYLLYNNRASKPMTNEDASQEADAGNMTGLRLNGSKEKLADNAVWTITAANGAFTVQDSNGKYLTIGNNNASLSDTATQVDLVYTGSYWNIDKDGYYLNDAANKQVCASGWNGIEPEQTYDAASDAGSRWTIYRVEETQTQITEISVTGVYPGMTNMMLGDTLYFITVTGEAPEIPDASEPEETNPVETQPQETTPEDTTPSETTPVETKPEEDKPEDPKPVEPKPQVPVCKKDENCVLSKFEDIKVDDWYHDGIHFCVDEGIMNGMGEGKFAPTENTTRAQLVMMLYRLAGTPSMEGDTEPFTDVADTDWFYAPIVWAYKNKVVNGITATEFAPNASVTREQVATILYRYLGEPEGTGKLDAFPDVADVSEYAVAPLTWAVGEGLITGIAQADGTALLAPTGNATRAQIATILMRYLTAE